MPPSPRSSRIACYNKSFTQEVSQVFPQIFFDRLTYSAHITHSLFISYYNKHYNVHTLKSQGCHLNAALWNKSVPEDEITVLP